jgi:hypothetical protein
MFETLNSLKRPDFTRCGMLRSKEPKVWITITLYVTHSSEL